MNSENNKNKALVTNIQGFSTEDGPGIRTTVFFKGCPLTCPWCHNPEGLSRKSELIFYEGKCIGCGTCKDVCHDCAPIPGMKEFENCVSCFKCVEECPSTARQKMGKWYSVDDLTKEVLKDKVYYETSGGGVTASGGEAMTWAEFIREFFKRLQAEDVHTALDTSGVIGGDKLRSVLEYTNLALVDLKIMDEKRHKELIGVELKTILKHILEIDDFGKDIIIRVPVVPGYTDHKENLAKMADFASKLECLKSLELLPYHRMAEAKYKQLGFVNPMEETKTPTDEIMETSKSIFEKSGIKTIIAGQD
jgi:pyruvate formate lyase activating enzyme